MVMLHHAEQPFPMADSSSHLQGEKNLVLWFNFGGGVYSPQIPRFSCSNVKIWMEKELCKILQRPVSDIKIGLSLNCCYSAKQMAFPYISTHHGYRKMDDWLGFNGTFSTNRPYHAFNKYVTVLRSLKLWESWQCHVLEIHTYFSIGSL